MRARNLGIVVFVSPPQHGRVFTHRARVGLADVAPSGRARLDALARWLQDAAWADVADSGVDDDGVWIVRRVRVEVARFARFDERLAVDTFCSGTAPLWAERRSTVRGEDGALVEVAALWVHLDSAGARPQRLPAGFDAVYGAAANGRRVKARLRHPAAPPAAAAPRDWAFRAADLDLARHVNNSAYWAALEEELVRADPAEPFAAEIEHRAPADAGHARVHAAGEHRWISAGATVLATLRLG